MKSAARGPRRDHARIGALEARVSAAPDPRTVRQLLSLLEHHTPKDMSLGRYSASQIEVEQLAAAFETADGRADPGRLQALVGQCLSVLGRNRIGVGLPIAQTFMGRPLNVKGAPGFCGHRLDMFKDNNVISDVCMDCYKVQIIPSNLAALFQVHFIMLDLDLPGDNTRKCMIELREQVAKPYKGYIYADSEDEIRRCANTFRETLARHGIADVSVKITHGCSEYGLEYPEFRYADDGAHREFRRPADWAEKERAYWAAHPLPAPPAGNPAERRLSLRDVFAFQTWIDYAAMIGDSAVRGFDARPRDAIAPGFAGRVKAQSDQRQRELAELAHGTDHAASGSNPA